MKELTFAYRAAKLCLAVLLVMACMPFSAVEQAFAASADAAVESVRDASLDSTSEDEGAYVENGGSESSLATDVLEDTSNDDEDVDIDDKTAAHLEDDEAMSAKESDYVLAAAEDVSGLADVPALALSFPTAEGTAVSLSPQSASGALYYFVPSGVSLTNVKVNFSSADAVSVSIVDGKGVEAPLTNGGTVDIKKALIPVSDYESKIIVKAKGAAGTQTAEFYFMQSANIASVFVTSADPVNAGRGYIDGSADHSTKASGSVRVLSGDASQRHAGELSTIKGRGNSSWSADKKSYQIKLKSKADLLEGVNRDENAEEAKKWILLANPYDSTLERNQLAHNFAQDIGMQTSIDCESVDFYYDGEYRGTYLLTEKVEIGKGRVNIHDLEADIEAANPNISDYDALPTVQGTTSYGAPMQYVDGLTDPSDITGGYILESDVGFYRAEKSWFRTSDNSNYDGYAFVSKSPEYLSRNQILYVSNIVNEACLCLVNGGVNPDTGKTLSDYFDMDSLAQMFYINELTKNADTWYSSTYFYIPEGQTKIYSGPTWDFDGSFGIRKEIPEFQDTSNWLCRNGSDGLLDSEEFRHKVYELYNSGMKDVAWQMIHGSANDEGSIAYHAKRNECSRTMNTKVWGFATEIWSYELKPTYEENLAYLSDWASERWNWVDSQIALWGPDTSMMYRLYNPNSGEHFYTASKFERDAIVDVGWKYEGIGWYAPTTSSTPVYRLYSGTDHHYTTSADERDMLIEAGWVLEGENGVAWYSDDAQKVPLYRQFNPNVDPSASFGNSGSHNYTTSKSENDWLATIGWIEEGVGWYGVG